MAEAWKCPVCLELLYKPVVPACGHAACFWCCHLSMSGLANSACPVCRFKYQAFPNICVPLHQYLQQRYPLECEARREDTAAEEAASGVSSPDLGQPLAAAEPEPLRSLLGCVACGRLALRPAVLNCGHVVCQATCLRPQCAACGEPMQQPPAVCLQLQELAREAFPEAAAQREEEHAAAAAPPPGEAQPAAAAAAGVPGSSPEGESTTAAAEEERRASGGEAAAGGGAARDHIRQVALNVRRMVSGESFVHYGIGCDACGAFPITGRRYRCDDCPEAIGFDLCGVCMDRGVGGVLGRFNQRHGPEHRMALVPPRVTAMHLMQAANPELSMDQLLHLVQLATVAEDDDEDDDAPAAPGGAIAPPAAAPPQQQQQQEEGEGGGQQPVEAAASSLPRQQQEEGGEGEEQDRPIPPPRGRGPRPAQDPSAVWPSPSAPPG